MGKKPRPRLVNSANTDPVWINIISIIVMFGGLLILVIQKACK
jgi:hypothetical protein